MAVMAKRRPEDIIGEWGIRDVAPPSAAERKKLLAEVEINPLTGRPLKRRIRRFRPEADRYLASLGGPLPYMQRLRQIDVAIEGHTQRLPHAYPDKGQAQTKGGHIAARWDFGEDNDLIDRHNRYYPIEARLAMD